MSAPKVVIGLTAVIVSVTEETANVVVTRGGEPVGLPFGPFDPAGDRTLELSLRRWVDAQTGFSIGYVEQLYTFADRGREAPVEDLAGESPDRLMSIGYLALTPSRADLKAGRAVWRSWYDFFPWEDWRRGRPKAIDDEIAPRLRAWAQQAATPAEGEAHWRRVRQLFAIEGETWNEERALERYELLYEAGLAPEAARDKARHSGREPPPLEPAPLAFGEPMISDHRRILATAVSRLRAKIKYRPIVFEVAPSEFTLLQLQKIVEALSGLNVHKQNFRRMLTRTGLVIGAGRFNHDAGGRPAEVFKACETTLSRKPTIGVQVPTPKS